MSLNKSIIQGKIPTFDNAVKIYNEDDDKKRTLVLKVDVKRNYKPQGEQYYPSDLLDVKAFGTTAKFIYDYFPAGSEILLEGETRRNDNYEKDGETVYGQMYFHATNAYFAGAKGEGGGEAKPKEKVGTTSQKTQRSTNPLANKRGSFI